MQTPQQKHLESLIDSTLTSGSQALHQNVDQIVKLVSQRVDMPKHLIGCISKKLVVKEQDKISLIFDILWFVTEKYDNKIALFNQISGNKEFLFKISSILGLKQLNEGLKTKIIDIVYQWKEMFKDNKELFPNFWTFYAGFEKKGYVPSNMNFQTRHQQQVQPQETGGLLNSDAKNTGSDKNIFDIIQSGQGANNALDFSKIDKPSQVILYKLLRLLQLQNTIISNTNPQILDLPPILRQNMTSIKILQERINKIINEHKTKITIDTTMGIIKAVQLTQKRYTQLVTKYLPQKFQVPEILIRFDQFCTAHEKELSQAQSLNKEIDLLDITDNTKESKGGLDLLDLNLPPSQPKQQQKGIKNFFGNLLDRVNPPPANVTLSNKPIQDDFKTDLDLIKYKDPKTIAQHCDYVKNLTIQQLKSGLFKI